MSTDCVSCSEIQNAIRKQIIDLSNKVQPLSQPIIQPSCSSLLNNIIVSKVEPPTIPTSDVTLDTMIHNIIKKAILQHVFIDPKIIKCEHSPSPTIPPVVVQSTIPPVVVQSTIPPVVVQSTIPPIVTEVQPIVVVEPIGDAADAVLKLIDVARSLQTTTIVHTLMMLSEYLGKPYLNTRPVLCRTKLEFLSEIQRVSGKLAGNCATAHCCVVLTLVHNEAIK